MRPISIGQYRDGKADRYETLDILTAAFRDDPAVRSLYPTDLEYARYFPGFVLAFGGRAFEAGTIDLDAERNAAAVWFAPGVTPDEAAVMNHLELSVPKKRLAPFTAGLTRLGELRPIEPHWYLPWMGVLPEAQGMGVGSALLDAGLARADADGHPVYLEATSRRSAALYARHGFDLRSTVSLPDFPEILGMWRRPESQAAAASTRTRLIA